MKFRTLFRTAAATLTGLLISAVPASAAEGVMTFRMSADQKYLSEAELATQDIVFGGALYIDNYTGITDMKLRLKTDDPITIENGDFTRDPSRTDTDGGAKQSFFVSHGTTIYTGINNAGELKNIALWYGPTDIDIPGEVEDPESSFLSFLVRVPKGTPAGVYRGYVSTDWEYNIAGQKVYDFICNCKGETPETALEDFQIVVEPESLRGDVNCDGIVDVHDAQCLQIYYLYAEILEMDMTDTLYEQVFGTPYIHTAMIAADADRNSVMDTKDATAIQIYYTLYDLLEMTPDWDHLFD